MSTAALLVGVAASDATRPALLTACVAALSAGAMTMAIGEYVSVSARQYRVNQSTTRGEGTRR